MKQALWAACALVLGAALASALLRAPVDADTPIEDGEALAALATKGRGDRAGAPIAAPEWEVGDAWRVQFDEGEPLCWLVVASVSEEGIQQGVWCPTDEAEFIAAQIAAYEFHYIGRFTQALEGIGRAEAFRFYDWPLEDGKTWVTRWDEIDVQVTSTYSRADGRYQFEALVVDTGEPLVAYDYDPALEWWSEMEFASGYRFLVHERETGWELPVTVASGEDRYEAERVASLFGNPATIVGVAPEDMRLALMVEWSGVLAGRFELRGPDGTTRYETTLTGEGMSVFEIIEAEEGMWSIVDSVTGAGMESIRLRGIALEIVEF